jgi:hypothetical protein
VERKRRQPSLKKLYAQLKDAPPNLASLEIAPDGRMKAEFRPPGPVPTTTTTSPGAPPAPAVPLIPGTIFPDDKSPIDAADLTLHPIDLDEQN